MMLTAVSDATAAVNASVTIAIIGGIVSVFSATMIVVNTVITSRHSLELAKVKAVVAETRAAVAATKEAVVVLEKNTNSIKDALVKVTGESQYAKGVLDTKDGKT